MTIPTLALDRGLPVFPVKHREKVPATAHGFKDATTDSGQIARWAREIPGCNWGAAMGGGGVFALDVDGRNGGFASLRTLTGMNGDLPATLSASTGGGGVHYLFRLARPLDRWPSRIAPGLDIKGVGGYVVVEPSVHPNGWPYEWQNDEPIATAPAWLESRLRTVGKRIIEPRHTSTGGAFNGMTAAQLAAELDEQVIAKAGQFFVRCVAHRDTDPSLALRDGEGGRVLWHCFSGCSQTDLTDAILRRVRHA